MFPYEDSEIVSVRPYLRQYQLYISKWYMNGKVFTTGNPKNLFYKKNAYLSVSAAMFCNNFLLILSTLISLLSFAIHKHWSRSQHISVLTSYMHIYFSTSLHHKTFILWYDIGMHRRPFEGRHLVLLVINCAALIKLVGPSHLIKWSSY